MPIRPQPHPSRPPTSSGALVPPTIGRLYSVRTNFSVKVLDFVQLSGPTRSRPTFPPPALSLRQTAWVVLKERIFASRTRLPPLILDVPWIPTIELMWDPWVMSASELTLSRHLSVDIFHHLAVRLRERVAMGSITAGGTCTALTDSTYSHNVVGQLMGQSSQVVPSVGPVEDYPRRVSEQGKGVSPQYQPRACPGFLFGARMNSTGTEGTSATPHAASASACASSGVTRARSSSCAPLHSIECRVTKMPVFREQGCDTSSKSQPRAMTSAQAARPMPHRLSAGCEEGQWTRLLWSYRACSDPTRTTGPPNGPRS